MLKAIAVERSGNRKIGDCSATSASQVTCPSTCPYQNNGCYAEYGLQGIVTRRLNAAPTDALSEARDEASKIRKLSGKRPLRLHVVGDCSSDGASKTVADAAAEYHTKHGMPVWTYTHAWRDVKRRSWGSVSVLASTESYGDANRAMRRGYAASIVLPNLPQDGRAFRHQNVLVIPCPQQTGKSASCDKCRLCFDDQALWKRRAVIAFGAHGSGKGKVQRAIS